MKAYKGVRQAITKPAQVIAIPKPRPFLQPGELVTKAEHWAHRYQSMVCNADQTTTTDYVLDCLEADYCLGRKDQQTVMGVVANIFAHNHAVTFQHSHAI